MIAMEGLATAFCVNARTGAVQGERPYSWIKIAVAVVLVLIVLAIAAALFGAGGG
jgi:hypothetical protein